MRRARHRFTSLFVTLFLLTTAVIGVTATAAVAAPTNVGAFEGIRSNLDDEDPLNWGDAFTPDPKVAVGPDHVVQFANSTIGVFEKDGDVIDFVDPLELFATSQTAGTACASEDSINFTQTDVIYDSVSDRWIVAAVASLAETQDEGPYAPYYACLAASTTGNPLGDYHVAVHQLTLGNDLYLEHPLFGLWSTADGPSTSTLYLAAWQTCDSCMGSGNVSDFLFAPTDTSDYLDGGIGNRVWAFNVSDMESGSEVRMASTNGTGNLQGQNFPGPAQSGVLTDVVRPVSVSKSVGLPPSGRNAYLVGAGDYLDFFVDVWRLSTNWGTSTISITANATQIAASYNWNVGDDGSFIREPAPGNVLDTNADYTQGRVTYANIGGSEQIWHTQEVWSNGSAPNSGVNRVYWRKLTAVGNAAPAGSGGATQVAPSAGYGGVNGNAAAQDTTTNRWVPAGAVDKQGNFAVAYNVANSSTVFPGIRFSGRTAAHTANQLENEDTLQNGSGYQVGAIDDVELTEWGGAYGSKGDMTVDPDGCTFWSAHEYLSAPPFPTNANENTWNTKIGSYRFGGCSPDTLATSVAASGTGEAGSEDGGALKAMLTANGTGSGVGGKTISFSLGGDPVGSAVTNDAGIATLGGVDLSAYSAGTEVDEVSASFAGSTAYGSSSDDGDLLATGDDEQTITFGALAGKTFGDADFEVSATADASGPVTFTAAGACSVSGTTVHIKRAGNCTVTAHHAGDDTYAAAANVNQAFVIAKANQSITFAGGLPAALGTGTALTRISSSVGQAYVSGSSDSNLPVYFSSNDVCPMAGLNHPYSIKAGSCEVTANQPGSASYNAATPVMQSIAVSKSNSTATQKPTGASQRLDQINNTDSGSNWMAVWNAQLQPQIRPISDTIDTTNPTFTATNSSGTGTVATLTIPTGHGILVGQLINVTGGGDYDATAVAVTAQAATTVSYASTATGTGGIGAVVTQSEQVCTAENVAGQNHTAVTAWHSGQCRLSISTNGTDGYNAAGPTVFTKTITKGNQGGQIFTPGGAGNPKPADTPFDVTVQLTPVSATSQAQFDASGLVPVPVVAPASATSCQITNTVNSPGTTSATVTVEWLPGSSANCTINSTNAGNGDWNTRTSQSATYNRQKVDQTIDFPPIDDKTEDDPDFDPGATASSGLEVTYTVEEGGSCSIVDNLVHITGTGSCTVNANQAGNGIYNAAPQEQQSFNIGAGKSDQYIEFDAIPDKTFRKPVSFAISAISRNADTDDPTGLAVNFTASGDCTIIAGPKVKPTGGGECTVTAHQAGNESYHAAEDVDQSFTILPTPTKTVLKAIAPKTITSGGNVTLTAKVKFNPNIKKKFPQGGTVQFRVAPADGGQIIGTQTVNAKGIAKKNFTISLPAGNYRIQARFLLDDDNKNSASKVAKKKALKVT